MKNEIIIGTIGFIIAYLIPTITMVIIGMRKNIKGKNAKKKYQGRTNGIITNLDYNFVMQSEDTTGNEWYVATIKYLDSLTIKTKISDVEQVKNNEIKIGDSVEIAYDINNPQKATTVIDIENNLKESGFKGFKQSLKFFGLPLLIIYMIILIILFIKG